MPDFTISTLDWIILLCFQLRMDGNRCVDYFRRFLFAFSPGKENYMIAKQWL
jgi:hypothetical protein